MSRESRVVKKLLKRDDRPELRTAIGTDIYLPNHSGDHSKGKVFTTPTDDYHIANKKYVDDNSGGSGDAQTANPLSQFAATSSAQLAGVMSDETGTGALVFATSPTLVTPALGTPASGTLTNCTGLPVAGTSLVAGTNITLSTNTLNVDDAFIVNNADDTSTGKITAANFAVTGDNNTNDTEYVPMVLHGTDATPPTASTVPRGSIYIQYTA